MHSRLEANLCQTFPHDRAADAVQALENRARYQQQSRDTRDGERADPPQRAPLTLFVFHYED